MATTLTPLPALAAVTALFLDSYQEGRAFVGAGQPLRNLVFSQGPEELSLHASFPGEAPTLFLTVTAGGTATAPYILQDNWSRRPSTLEEVGAALRSFESYWDTAL